MQQACFPHKGDSGFISNSRGIRGSFSFPLLAIYRTKIIAVCPQLHQVVDEDIPTITPSPIDNEDTLVAAQKKSTNEIRIGPITRARAKLLEQQVNLLLIESDYFVNEN